MAAVESLAATTREAALVQLGDRLRTLDESAAMAFAAAQITGRALDADRAGYGAVDILRETVDIERDWTRPAIPSGAGRRRFRDWSSVDALRRGEAVAAGSVLEVPIFESGEFVAVFRIERGGDRAWSPEEILFVRGVGDRTRSALEHRRAEDERRELAASLEREVARRTAYCGRMWRLSADLMLIARFDGVVAAVNPAWTTVLGWRERDLVGVSLFDLAHPDDARRTEDFVRLLSKGAAVRRFDARQRHRDGAHHWISWTATPDDELITAIGRDFTAEKMKIDDLERSEARMRSVFETSYQFQGLLTTDGVLLDANPISLAAIEADWADVVGQPFWETPWFSGTPGLPQQIRAAVPSVAAGESFRREILVNLPTGRRAFDFSMRPVLNAAGAVIAIVPEAMELTERRAAEEQLRQAQKMEAVGQLTGGLAHDFNNILTGVMGSLELMKIRMGQGRLADVDRYISAAQGAASRAAALTHRLLAFSRRQTLDPKPTQANTLVAGMEDLVRHTVGPQIRVETELADGLWPTICDPHQLESALLNLCINARDAMPDGGRLTIETANTWVDPQTAASWDIGPGPYVTICVADTGAGMTPEVMARAFDPFFTTKPIGMGAGLGLSMIFGFARQSGGQVNLRSRPGEGAAVRIFLPRYAGEAGTAEHARVDGWPSRVAAGETILVVDDEPLVRALVLEVLRDLGFTALEAVDAASGLKALQSDASIGLLITDVGLPGGLNGRQMADAARERRPDLKVLFITGYAEKAAIGDSRLAPGMQVITKPFAMETIANKIRDMLASP